MPRSADVYADEDVVAFELTAASLNEIFSRMPVVGYAVLKSIARQLAERLRQATEDLRLRGA
jgi:CRP-like cAMP-binding protein